MPTYFGYEYAEAVPSSDDPLIAGLLWGTKWSGDITYSFPGQNASWSPTYPQSWGIDPRKSFVPVTSAQQEGFRIAVGKWAELIAVPITETSDGFMVGDIRVATYREGTPVAGFSQYPANNAEAGDMWFASWYGTVDWSPGAPGQGYSAILHEIGHTLGLKHPHDGAPLPPGWDDVRFTVMSYNSYGHYSTEPTTPMLLDVQAIQYLYGANYTTRAGDTVYEYGDAGYHETIWDGGGNDTIRCSASLDAVIDLNAGHGSSIGRPVVDPWLQPLNSIWIAFDCMIENATGGAGDDTLIGNAANNVLNGGAGTDTAAIGVSLLDVQSYSKQPGSASVTSWNGTDSLLDIERVELTDALFAFDTYGPDGHAWQAAALYRAAFGSLPSRQELSHWTARADRSSDMGDLGQAMINQFAPGISSPDLVTYLYSKLVGLAPTAETVQMFVGMIGPGQTYETQGDLFAYAASLSLNTEQLVGFAGTVQRLDPSWF